MSKKRRAAESKKYYRVDFHERAGQLSLDRQGEPPNTAGRATIAEKCGELEYQFFRAFVCSAATQPLTTESVKLLYQQSAKMLAALKKWEIQLVDINGGFTL